MIIEKIKKNRGFVILFAVTIASILLSIALGVANIAYKEVKFGTSGKDTNDAFFAADTGIECALFNDKPPSTAFAQSGSSGTAQCLGNTINLTGTFPSWNFIVSGLGSAGTACAKVSVYKIPSPPLTPTTNIVSKGYNTGDSLCASSNPDRTEREIDINY